MKKLAPILALLAGLAASSLDWPTAFAQPAAPSRAASAAELETVAIELADNTMRTFIEGVRQKDLSVLGPLTSLNFRRSYSPQVVNDAFKSFFALKIIGDPLAGKSPIFLKAPGFGTDKRLAVEGLYELPDGLLLFQLAYVREGTGWKLDGINVRSQPYDSPGANPATNEKPLKFKIPAGKLVEA